MQRLTTKLIVTGTLAALVWAIPVSIDLARPPGTTTNLTSALGIGLKVDSAEARIGRPATPRSTAGVVRRTTRRTVRRVAAYGGAVVARPAVAGAAVTGAAVTTGAATRTRRAAPPSSFAASPCGAAGVSFIERRTSHDHLRSLAA